MKFIDASNSYVVELIRTSVSHVVELAVLLHEVFEVSVLRLEDEVPVTPRLQVAQQRAVVQTQQGRVSALCAEHAHRALARRRAYAPAPHISTVNDMTS